jgi:hypothetical protein
MARKVFLVKELMGRLGRSAGSARSLFGQASGGGSGQRLPQSLRLSRPTPPHQGIDVLSAVRDVKTFTACHVFWS